MFYYNIPKYPGSVRETLAKSRGFQNFIVKSRCFRKSQEVSEEIRKTPKDSREVVMIFQQVQIKPLLFK